MNSPMKKANNNNRDACVLGPFCVVMHFTHENLMSALKKPSVADERMTKDKMVASVNAMTTSHHQWRPAMPVSFRSISFRFGVVINYESASLAKCLDQIQPTRSLGSSWFLASQSSPFSAITSKIW